MSAILRVIGYSPFVSLAILACLAMTAKGAEPSSDSIQYFEKEVRPLLISQCQKCHGEKKQESSLRVDSLAALIKGGISGPAIVPGKVDQGTFLKALRHQGDLKMPPAGKLKDPQIAVFAKWIADGAVWPNEKAAQSPSGSAAKHWAFQPILNSKPPQVAEAPWSQSPLDRFVFAAMKSKGLNPVNRTDKRTLIRRLTFDLTGLPPTPEEIHEYLSDNSLNATEKLVDRLLASKSYGERWGRHWLDVARYADTAGDGADYPVREAGKYRDWVIKAINDDMPIDRFIREQIAGDIYAGKDDPAKFADHVTATGFLAIGKRYGYAPNADYQYLDFADAIDSVGRSILGLSLGCARCHDHKYDPITMADYYALYGIFQSTKWAFPGGEESVQPSSFPPLVPLEEATRLEKLKKEELVKIDRQIKSLESAIAGLDGSMQAGGIEFGFEKQTIGKPPTAPWLSVGPNTILNEAQSPFRHVHLPGNRGVRVGTGLPTDGIRYVLPSALRFPEQQQIAGSIDFRTVAPTEQKGSYRLYFGRGVIESLAVHFSVSANEIAIGDGTKWETLRKLTPGEWYSLQFVIDPKKKTVSGMVGKIGDLTEFKDKQINPKWDGIVDTFICDGIGHAVGKTPVHDLDNLSLMDRQFTPIGGREAPPRLRHPNEQQQLESAKKELEALKKQESAIALKDAFPVAYGVSEGSPINAKIQKRGEPDKLGDEVPRRFISVLGGDEVPKTSKGSGRFELAEWLTRPSNTLTPRVFVNRVWAWHFGRGLVPTASDFGLRGEPPSHPELLDWLTKQFVDSGWSLKKLHRLILLSQTYQLSSEDNAKNSAIDPENRWHWRHSRQALDAESIRDSMLFVSGKLDRTPAPVHPFPMVQMWRFTIHNPFHAVYDSDRRSVYLMVQRNRRHPYLALFDAADPNLSASGRLPTTTPTQTLYLMNSPFVHTQSESFANRIESLPGDDQSKLRYAIELTQGRAADPSELTESSKFLTDYRRRLAETGITAEKQSKLAWAALGRVLMTSNAFLYAD